MNFKQAIKFLGVEDYEQRIFNSNSRGELLHLSDYIMIAETFKDEEDMGWFREWFVEVVNWTSEHWERPESVFQHIPQLMKEAMK